MADITIEIPVEIGQRWTIIGTDGRDVQSNIGPATVLGLSAGTYTIEWGLVVGTVPPFPNTFESPPLGPDDTYTFVSPTYVPLSTNLTAIWANDGADKVMQEDLRALAGSVINHAWDGSKVTISGASNEVVEFSLYLESSLLDSTNVTVSFDQLDLDGTPGPNSITSATRAPADLFKWEGSNIELFYTRYLQISGLSVISYDGQSYDEQHVPDYLRRANWTLTGTPPNERGIPDPLYEDWEDRPGSDQYYPDILVPMEAIPSEQFTVVAGQTQQIWCDIYIPKGTTPGTYTGTVSIAEDGGVPQPVPVQLTVYNFELSDESAAPAFAYISDYDINTRHYGANRPTGNPESVDTRDNYVKMLHRHRLSVVGDDQGHLVTWPHAVLPEWWTDRLTGDLFLGGSPNYYDGPGQGVGNRIYPIGMYADWRAKTGWTDDVTSNKPTAASFQTMLEGWETIFSDYDTANPTQPVERFLYLADEPSKPSGYWDLASIGTSTPTATEFVVSSVTKDGPQTIRIHRSALGLYTTNAATHFKDYLEDDIVILSRADDPENQYAIYILTADVTLEGPPDGNGDGNVRVMQCVPLPDRANPGSAVQIAGDVNFGIGEDWYISSGSNFAIYYHDVNEWARWATDTGTGIKSFSTVSWGKSNQLWGVPNVDHPAHTANFDSTSRIIATEAVLEADSERLKVVYNGKRPLIGSIATEDEGVALRTIPWAQYRLGIDWWFSWEATLYYNYTTENDNDLFREARTWGAFESTDSSKGKTGPSYGNGNGVLLYPGSTVIPEYLADNYGLDGPISSIRIKMWRRGIQDVEYVVAAKAEQLGNPTEEQEIQDIVDAAVPEALWEVDVVDDPDDPGYAFTDISWSIDPDVWQTYRAALAALAEP